MTGVFEVKAVMASKSIAIVRPYRAKDDLFCMCSRMKQ